MESANRDLRVLIFAPIGRDSTLTAELLQRAQVPCHICRSVAEISEGIRDGAGAVLMTEEALADPNIEELAETLAAQPPWSDISVLLFAGTDRSDAEYRTLQRLEVLRNVTLLDRPVRTTAVVSTVRAALRGRQRQYELRDVLVALHTARNEAESARDAAQHANRLKDEFLATLSHELRTPLNAILGWVVLLRDQLMDPAKVPHVLDIIERNATSQAQLISDVLDVSRMITGRVRLNIEPLLLSRVITEALDTVRPAADAKRIQLVLDIEDKVPPISGDVGRLRQVFWNLLSNAIKFTPQAGRVEVRLRRRDAHLEVVVSDNGVGIPREFLPYAFDRFRQADQTFTRPHGGLGLGLAIVKHLVEVHGGEVTVASEGRGHGAAFTVRIPIAGIRQAPTSDPPGTSTEAASVKHDRFSETDLSNQFVLVVDDDPSTRELLVTVLSECGARVAAAASARAALDHLDTEVPTLIVADIGMPEQDGLTMMRTIRTREEHRGGVVPAVALSAYARLEDREAALAAGFNAFVTKPTTPSALISAIEQTLAARPR